MEIQCGSFGAELLIVEGISVLSLRKIIPTNADCKISLYISIQIVITLNNTTREAFAIYHSSRSLHEVLFLNLLEIV